LQVHCRAIFKALWGFVWAEGIATVRTPSFINGAAAQYITDLIPSTFRPTTENSGIARHDGLRRWHTSGIDEIGLKKPGIDAADARLTGLISWFLDRL
jgi:hypothetical protein